MLASLLGPSGLTLLHVVLGVAGAAFGYWLNAKKAAPAPTLADVVPAAHLSTVQSLIAKAEADPSFGPVVKLVIDRAEQAAVAYAHDLLQGLAAPPAAVPAIPVSPAPAAK